MLKCGKINVFNSKKNSIQFNLESFSRELSVNFSTTAHPEVTVQVAGDVVDSAIFMLQTIEIGGKRINLFFDNGCGNMVIKRSAVDTLMELGRANLEVPGPLHLSGVGGLKSVCDHGEYSVRLPLKDGSDVVLRGLCLDKVTTDFPTYPLDEVTKDTRSSVGKSKRKKFPKMPKEVGGDTDILIGVKYTKIFPDLVHKFPSGLCVSRSPFLSHDGTDGVFHGPHAEFTKAERAHGSAHSGHQVYFTLDALIYRSLTLTECEVPLLGLEKNVEEFRPDICEPVESPCICVCRKELKALQKFQDVENAGTDISYRCVDCRNCPECKRSPRIESISIQEEIEQNLIDRCVEVDISQNKTTSSLPFLTSDPDSKLAANERASVKNYKVQARKLEKHPEDKITVMASERKLHDLGFVGYYDDLSVEEKALFEGKLNYYIPWRVQWNMNSLSTVVRLVFDASHSSPGGCSLNSLLAKGANSMNKMIEILIRWTTYPFAYHTDIQKMYNAVLLKKELWRYQMYHWRDDLASDLEPRRKVIKTLIYGVRPSGNLAERGLRLTAEKVRHLYPRAADVINKDLYVDDCASGEHSQEERNRITDNLKLAPEKGGFSLKGYTFSGFNPPDHLSKDGLSITVILY